MRNRKRALGGLCKLPRQRSWAFKIKAARVQRCGFNSQYFCFSHAWSRGTFTPHAFFYWNALISTSLNHGKRDKSWKVITNVLYSLWQSKLEQSSVLKSTLTSLQPWPHVHNFWSQETKDVNKQFQFLLATWQLPPLNFLSKCSLVLSQNLKCAELVTLLVHLLYQEYRVSYCSISRKLRKIVKNKYRYVRRFECLFYKARWKYSTWLLRLALLFRSELTYGARLSGIFVELLFDPTSSLLLSLRYAHRTHTLAMLRLQ
jgi:hypothetical protein